MTVGALIVGASLAGLRAAEQLRAAGYAGPMTIAGSEPYMPYNRPPLSKDVLLSDSADGAEDLKKLLFGIRPTLNDVTWRLGSAAVASDLDKRTVTFSDGAVVSYDVLAIATGLRPRRLPFSGGEINRHVVRSLDDAIRLRSSLKPGLRVLVAGGGFIGCESAATAAKRGCTVTIVESLSAPMVRALGEPMAQAFQRYHESKGVQFKCGVSISNLETDPHDAQRFAAALLSDGSRLEFDLLIEAIGSHPNVEWLEGNGLDLKDGVLTDNAMCAGGRPDVTAMGDVARFANPRFDETPRRVEHWAIPGFTAKRAAESMNAYLTGKPNGTAPFAPLPTFWSDQFDARMQSMGMPGLGTSSTVIDGRFDNIGVADSDGLAVGYARDGKTVGIVTVGVPVAKLGEYRKLVT